MFTCLALVTYISLASFSVSGFEAPSQRADDNVLPESLITQQEDYVKDYQLFHENRLFYYLENIHYFSSHSHAAHSLTSQSNIDFTSFEPITILSIKMNGRLLDTQKLRETIGFYLEDDVFSTAWLRSIGILLQDLPLDSTVSLNYTILNDLTKDFGTRQVLLDQRIEVVKSRDLPSKLLSLYTLDIPQTSSPVRGPYLAHSPLTSNVLRLYPVYRLYPDTYKTFASGVYPLHDGKGSYATLGRVDQAGNLLIPVPSRLYSMGNSSTPKPLVGSRVAVKDVFDMKGVYTAAGSRVYREWKKKLNETASSLEKLEKVGCAIVGKAKSSHFARIGDSIEWTFDELYPFSPRADQYLSCGSSSSGPACAIASYDWLDFAVGTDTAGSIRGPAAGVGVYGNRPTPGMIALDGIMPMTVEEDTIGVLTRNPDMLKEFLETWYSGNKVIKPHSKLPRTIRVPSETVEGLSPELSKLILGFVEKVAQALEMNVEMINMTAAGMQAGWTPKVLDDLVMDINGHLTEASQWKLMGQNLVMDYWSNNDGRFPPIGSDTFEAWRWARDANWTQKDYEQIYWRTKKFSDWYNGIILGRDDQTCSQNIYMEPLGLDEIPFYREASLNDHRLPVGFRNISLTSTAPCSLAGCPHFVAPIGQVSYQSLVSEKVEMVPVTMSIIAASGCDFMLLSAIDKLTQVGVLQEVMTGKTAFKDTF
ncbi:hypothetical protein L204_105880 [Cryptococcus depauperatus]